MQIGVIVALAGELPDGWRAFEGRGFSITGVVSGVGRRRAFAATEGLCVASKPDLLVSLGFCGAVRDGLNPGDILLFHEVTCGDRFLRLGTGHWHGLEERLAGRATVLSGCRLQTCDSVVLSRAGISAGVDAVDMETWAVAVAGEKARIPVVAARVVSDVVPVRATASSIYRWLRGLQGGTARARAGIGLLAGAWPIS